MIRAPTRFRRVARWSGSPRTTAVPVPGDGNGDLETRRLEASFGYGFAALGGPERRDHRIRRADCDGVEPGYFPGGPRTIRRPCVASLGKYLARMNADDICASERLQLQTEFMENNPDIGISGGYHSGFASNVLIMRCASFSIFTGALVSRYPQLYYCCS